MKCTLCDKPLTLLETHVKRPPNPEVTYIISNWSCDHCKTLVEVKTTIAPEDHWEKINAIYGRTDL